MIEDRAPASDRCVPSGIRFPRSGQALLRHMNEPAYGCFLPDLTRFTRGSLRRTRPSTRFQGASLAAQDLGQEFDLAAADCELQGTATSPSSTVRISISDPDADRNRTTMPGLSQASVGTFFLGMMDHAKKSQSLVSGFIFSSFGNRFKYLVSVSFETF